MPTPKDAIAEALLSLDHTNDKLWTDDGSPLVTEVQRLCNDNKITRAQINEALPGFARKTSDSVSEDEQPDDITDETPAEAEPAVAASDVQAEGDEADLDLSPEEEHERLRALAHQRVRDAELALSEAKDHVAEANRAVLMAEQRLTRALNTFAAKYPPISVAENIQQHIKRQQEVLRERITGSRFEPNVAANPVDATLMDRKRDNGRNGKGPKDPTPFLPRKASVSY